VSARSALIEGSLGITFVLVHPRRCSWTQRIHARSAQASEASGFANLRELLRDYYCRCAQSRRLQHLDEVEGFPQGVHANFLSEDLESCGKIQEGLHREVVLKYSSRRTNLRGGRNGRTKFRRIFRESP
jgi:hypothetical protein